MENGRERRPSGNWRNNSGPDTYHFINNGSHRSNGNWENRQHGRGHGGGGDDKSFPKFRDPNQLQQSFSERQSPNQRGGGGQHQNNVGTKGRDGGRDTRDNAKDRDGRDTRRGGKGRRGRQGRGGRGRGGDRQQNNYGPWYNDVRQNDLFFYDNGQLGNENIATASLETPLPPEATAEAPKEEAPVPVKPVAATVTPEATEKPAPAEKPITVPISAGNIKKEKKDPVVKQPPQKPVPSSDEASSSSSDESVEAGEVVKKTEAAAKSKVKVEKVTKPPVTSSSEEESDDSSPPPVKKKALAKESTPKPSKSLKKHTSEEDVVCLGKEKRKFTISDEDEEQDEVDEDPKKDKPCGICDKKGHTSFECQMICGNCSASYHSLKNCPKPPNLNIAMQAFMEFTMQQLTAFNADKRFTFPAGVVAPPPVLTPAVAAKAKKDKRAPIKKSKKTPKKRLKVEAQESEDDDDDDDDDNDDDDESEADATSENDSSESSADASPTVSKAKRKRTNKQIAASKMAPATAAFPFQMLAAGAPYNPMMYPYAAPFSFPK